MRLANFRGARIDFDQCPAMGARELFGRVVEPCEACLYFHWLRREAGSARWPLARTTGGLPLDHQREVVSFLSDGATYGMPGLRVERIETHISIIFLAGDRAFKL